MEFTCLLVFFLWELGNLGRRSGLQELEPTVCPEDKFISTLRCLPGLNVSEYGVCVCVCMYV